MKNLLVFAIFLLSLIGKAQPPFIFNNSTEGTAVPILKLTSGTGGVANSGGSIEFYKSSNNPMGRIYTGNIYSNGVGDSKGKLILSSYYNVFKDELVLYNGNVGINTPSPVAPLDVNGNVIIGNGTTGSNVALTIRGPNSPTNTSSFQDINYSFTSAGSARIRAFRGGSWDTHLQFLTNKANAGSDIPDVKMHIDGNGNIGLGTTVPSQKLEVIGTVLSNSDLWKPYGFYTSKHANFFTQNAYYDGTWKSYLGGGEYSKASVCVASTPDDCAFGVMVDNSIATANEPIAFTTLFNIKTSGNVLVPGKVLVGSVNESLIGQYLLSVNGAAIFTKVVVKNYGTWADYVFEPTYNLRSLQSLEEYIIKYKHLPDVPSAADVAKDGNDIAATQIALLKKIEELTLYVIEQDKENKKLKQRVEQIEKRINAY